MVLMCKSGDMSNEKELKNIQMWVAYSSVPLKTVSHLYCHNLLILLHMMDTATGLL